MSINLLTQDIHKEWLNARVNDLTVDGNLGLGGDLVVVGDLTVTGNELVSGNLTVVGDLTVDGTFIQARTIGAVTQATSTTTAVTLNANEGIVTTFTSTMANGTGIEFTVNNSLTQATDIVLATLIDYSGTYGTNALPSICIDSIAAGSFKIVVLNNHSSFSLSGVLKVGFQLLHNVTV